MKTSANVLKADGEHGPLPLFLHLLTLVTGLVDAVSFLDYGHVFVANMTGNIVILGFALAGAPSISISGSLIALAAFLLGALGGGTLSRRGGAQRANLLAILTSIEVPLLLIAAVMTLARPTNAIVVIAALGMTMGLQTAVARGLAVPDVTTTVLSMILTGIAADSSFAGGSNPRLARRIIAVIMMLIGAFCGAWIVLHASVSIALFIAAIIIAASDSVPGSAAVTHRAGHAHDYVSSPRRLLHRA